MLKVYTDTCHLPVVESSADPRRRALVDFIACECIRLNIDISVLHYAVTLLDATLSSCVDRHDVYMWSIALMRLADKILIDEHFDVQVYLNVTSRAMQHGIAQPNISILTVDVLNDVEYAILCALGWRTWFQCTWGLLFTNWLSTPHEKKADDACRLCTAGLLMTSNLNVFEMAMFYIGCANRQKAWHVSEAVALTRVINDESNMKRAMCDGWPTSHAAWVSPMESLQKKRRAH